MSNIGGFRQSDNLLERAAYWAASWSWEHPEDFEAAQGDSTVLQSFAAQWEEFVKDHMTDHPQGEGK